MKAVVIIVAAGSGTRFGAKKQFTEVAGKPLYYYSIKAFRPYAEKIILVVPKEDVEVISGSEASDGAAVIAGGKNRYDSVYNAIKAITGSNMTDASCGNTMPGAAKTKNRSAGHGVSADTIVMIHDGARPCITGEVIERVMKDTQQYDAAVASVPVTDTIRTVDGELMDRSKLRAMQTPQSFKYGLLREAFDKLMGLPEEAVERMHITDDVQVVDSMMGVNAFMSDGDPKNIKVTTPSDIQFLHLS